MNALDEVVRKYPNTEYAAAAKRKIEVARDQLAGKEMNTARFYQKKRDYVAAINRFKVVITQYQTTRHVEEALMRLTETYMSLGIVNEAQTAAAVLGHNFPDSPWYKDAYALVRGGGLEPYEDQGSWISKAFRRVGLGFAAEPAKDAVHCERGVQGLRPQCGFKVLDVPRAAVSKQRVSWSMRFRVRIGGADGLALGRT